MRAIHSYTPMVDVEATVSSKGQVTLPKAIRDTLGIETGSRIRFSLTAHGGFQCEPVRYELDDIWRLADSGLKPEGVMSFEEMDAAKTRRIW